MVTRSIRYGRQDIHFTLKRKDVSTLSFTVHPDGKVAVIAPLQADEDLILKRVTKRACWISRQQERFTTFIPKATKWPDRTGQSIRYLGRQYRVRVVALTDSHRQPVARNRNVLEVRLRDPNREGALTGEIERWWNSMAHAVIGERYARCLALVPGIKSPGFSLRKMAKRWGSFTSSGRILLNPELLATPVDCIDYVIVHELCHVKHTNHQRAFYRMLESILPDWKRRKDRLESCEI